MLRTMSDDRVIRAMTRDGSFRVIAARTTRTVQQAVRAQGATGVNATQLADLMTLSVLYRETMAPTLRVQAIVRGAEGGQMVADSDPSGWCRGLVRGRAGAPLDLTGDGALLQMMRPMRHGEPHVGTVALPADGRLANAAVAYFDQSEQIPTMVSLGTVVADDDDSHVVASGGFLVQILPEARDLEGPMAVMTFRLEDFVDIRARLRDTDASPETMIDEVLYGFDTEILGSDSLRFGCACSEDRLRASLYALDADAFAELMASDEPIESRCDYCGTVYSIDPATLRRP